MDICVLEILNQYSFYNKSSKYFQDEIISVALNTKLEKNTYFYKRNWQCNHIALVGSGRVRVFIVGDTGREITLYHVQPGDTCPINILSAMLNKSTPAIAVVEEPLNVVLLPVEIFKKWVKEQSIVQQFVFESLGGRLIDVLSLMEQISFQKIDQRIACFLLEQFELSDCNPPIAKMTHMQIATELGSAREVISRTLGCFERMGVVELERGRVIRKDHDALLQISHI